MFRKCHLSPEIKKDAKGLVLSFWAEWEDKFRDDEIRVVYRKIAPVIPTPAYLYVYLNKPAQRVVGRAPLESIAKLPLEECMRLAPKSGYSSEDIKTYAGRLTGTGLYVYTLGRFEEAPNPLPLNILASRFNFVPTPQAILLAEHGLRDLNECLGLT